ncbi:DUF4258 domain-containing protein [Spirosoma foliorum]|uniref:DUF4258 domain-containing protein n=1 Tax=Spirosoma foliorum TaxID=2710596 RepID=A0A7G5H666_9BACT|nr:DUF4258 domain-containing protein [Spirosoma foliorum]QMW06608.1 DUF4258 domain-containing protein [Spirosoma foliorum]
MPFDVTELQLAVEKGHIEWRKHTLQRLVERQIRQKDVLNVLSLGEAIRYYYDDRPFPSVLMFGWVEDRPLHVVASYAKADDMVYIITVYEPSLDVFESDYKTKKQ